MLPPEMIVEILARLPVKALFRLKCICKSWLNLISGNPQFSKLHLHYAKHDSSVNRYKLFRYRSPFQSIDQDAFCYGNNHVTRELNFPIIDVQPTEFEVIGSCNGLIAACWNDEHIIVWNPTTGDFRELPAINFSCRDTMFFGYDSHLDDYKIVKGLVSIREKTVHLEVFYLKAREWRPRVDLHTSFTLNRFFHISSNGFHHWLVDLPDQKLGIVSLHLGEEKFLEMVPVPEDITNRLSGLEIRGVGDNVWVCKNSQGPADYFEGWMMKRDESETSWTKLYSFRSVSSLEKLSKVSMDVIWVGIDGNVVLDADGFELVLYNPNKQTSLEYGLDGEMCYHPVFYMETLVSPNAI
ncbi:F-box family protein [Euphorbia peplus]|nr:F-box family protein [Euphorbia peplus]